LGFNDYEYDSERRCKFDRMKKLKKNKGKEKKNKKEK